MGILISIGERLKKVRLDMGLSQSEFAEIAHKHGVPGATRQSQANYEKDKQVPGVAYLAAIEAAGADTHYILTGESEAEVRLGIIAESAKKAMGLPVNQYCQSAVMQLLVGMDSDDMALVTDALSLIKTYYVEDAPAVSETQTDYANSELTAAEKDLVAAYRKAAPTDRTLIERLIKLTEKEIEDEAEPGSEGNEKI